MELSVIIPTYNRKKKLVQTLNEYCNQNYKNFEIIIVDDGSSDGTREAVEALNLPFKVKYFFQQNKGPATARNLGIKNSESRLIFFAGDDIIPSNNLLAQHLKFHNSNNESIAVLGYTKWWSKLKITPFRKYLTDYHFSYSAIEDPNDVYWGYFFTSNISVSRSLLIKAGLFCEEFPYAAYEDTEIGYRLHKLGMKMIFNKNAIAFHNHEVSFKDYQKTMHYKGESAVILAQKVSSLQRKASYKETKNLLRFIFKKIIMNDWSIYIITTIICFFDKLSISLPNICYAKVLDYYRIKGIKKAEMTRMNK